MICALACKWRKESRKYRIGKVEQNWFTLLSKTDIDNAHFSVTIRKDVGYKFDWWSRTRFNLSELCIRVYLKERIQKTSHRNGKAKLIYPFSVTNPENAHFLVTIWKDAIKSIDVRNTFKHQNCASKYNWRKVSRKYLIGRVEQNWSTLHYEADPKKNKKRTLKTPNQTEELNWSTLFTKTNPKNAHILVPIRKDMIWNMLKLVWTVN